VVFTFFTCLVISARLVTALPEVVVEKRRQLYGLGSTSMWVTDICFLTGYLMKFSIARPCSAEWMDDRLMMNWRGFVRAQSSPC
jgi:hypothetical protein